MVARAGRGRGKDRAGAGEGGRTTRGAGEVVESGMLGRGEAECRAGGGQLAWAWLPGAGDTERERGERGLDTGEPGPGGDTRGEHSRDTEPGDPGSTWGRRP